MKTNGEVAYLSRSSLDPLITTSLRICLGNWDPTRMRLRFMDPIIMSLMLLTSRRPSFQRRTNQTVVFRRANQKVRPYVDRFWVISEMPGKLQSVSVT